MVKKMVKKEALQYLVLVNNHQHLFCTKNRMRHGTHCTIKLQNKTCKGVLSCLNLIIYYLTKKLKGLLQIHLNLMQQLESLKVNQRLFNMQSKAIHMLNVLIARPEVLNTVLK